MSKSKQAKNDSFDLTLGEFCARLSAKDRRVELIGGFHADEVANGRNKDSEKNFMTRFRQFAERPVN